MPHLSSQTTMPLASNAHLRVIEEALNETIEAIVEAARLRIGNSQLAIELEDSARQAWRDHYKPRYTYAIVMKGMTWQRGRAAVLKRATQVGLIAATVASLRLLVGALADAGVGMRPGQNVNHPGALGTAVVDASIAHVAARWVDCVARGADSNESFSEGPPLNEFLSLLVEEELTRSAERC